MAKKKYIETPEKLWELFIEYKTYLKANPKHRIDYKGSDVQKVIYPLELPLTMVGFECWVADKEIIESLDKYFSNTDDAYTEYRGICTRITNEIRADQIQGGMVNIYNTSITQRLNSLVEKTEVKKTLNIPILPDIGNRK